ncbi:MAG: alpha-L-fucosidase, partial [Clostridia bacterium]|nr:alpha-L-fucosidase [Clostridia bacterium]
MDKHFEPTFQSLRQYSAPDWFRDAKFGIWSHWGPQSVPMFGDWYARNIYIEGTPQYEYHVRHYGHPSKFGYKDICALWKAENFENMLLAVTALGYQSCWYEGHITDTDRIGDKMARILGVPEGYELVCFLPVGIGE